MNLYGLDIGEEFGKYTDYVTSNEFIKRHQDLMNQTSYIYCWMSDLYELEDRILESKEDLNIFTLEKKSVKENINFVYDLYKKLNKIIIDNNIKFTSLDFSRFETKEDDKLYIDQNIDLMLDKN